MTGLKHTLAAMLQSMCGNAAPACQSVYDNAPRGLFLLFVVLV